MKKTLTMILSLALVAALSIAGTLAYLTAKTTEVENVFTVGKVGLELTETTSDYKMVPGQSILKDPKITVTAGSEASWIFVKIEEANNANPKFIDWAVRTGWTQGDGTGIPANVWYRSQDAIASGAEAVSYYVLDCKDDSHENCNGCVLVNENITNAQMESVGSNNPKLTLTGYAIQRAGFEGNAAGAWNQIQEDLAD